MDLAEQELSIITPEEVKKDILDLRNNNSQELDDLIDKICVKSGFRVSKYSGGKSYIYYSCHYGGRVREKMEDEKERDKKSKKLSK